MQLLSSSCGGLKGPSGQTVILADKQTNGRTTGLRELDGMNRMLNINKIEIQEDKSKGRLMKVACTDTRICPQRKPNKLVNKTSKQRTAAACRGMQKTQKSTSGASGGVCRLKQNYNKT